MDATMLEGYCNSLENFDADICFGLITEFSKLHCSENKFPPVYFRADVLIRNNFSEIVDGCKAFIDNSTLKDIPKILDKDGTLDWLENREAAQYVERALFWFNRQLFDPKRSIKICAIRDFLDEVDMKIVYNEPFIKQLKCLSQSSLGADVDLEFFWWRTPWKENECNLPVLLCEKLLASFYDKKLLDWRFERHFDNCSECRESYAAIDYMLKRAME